MRYLIFYISLFSFLACMQIYYGKGMDSCFNNMCISGVSSRVILTETMFFIFGVIGLHGMTYNLIIFAKNNSDTPNKLRLFYIMIFSVLSLFLSASIEVATI